MPIIPSDFVAIAVCERLLGDHTYVRLTYQLCNGGTVFEIFYDWRNRLSYFSNNRRHGDANSLHKVMYSRHRKPIRSGNRIRKFSVKPMLNIMGVPLADWEELGEKCKCFISSVIIIIINIISSVLLHDEN